MGELIGVFDIRELADTVDVISDVRVIIELLEIVTEVLLVFETDVDPEVVAEEL